jgi:alkylation response protein AidB-like acyl-CoA dehydrogenase
MVNASTFHTFYDDVRVPDSAIIGELHGGWNLIVNQLNYERVGLAPPGMMERNYEDVLAWARETTRPDGSRVIDQQWVQLGLARVRAGIEFLTLLNWKVAALEAAGESVNPADASSIKVFGTEFFCDAYQILMEIVGQSSALTLGSPAAALASRLTAASRAPPSSPSAVG